MTEQEELPTAAEVQLDPDSGYPSAEVTDYGYHLKSRDELVRRQDVEQLIKNKIEEHRDRVDELEEEHLLSESDMSNSDAHVLRKRRVKQIDALKEVLEEVHNQKCQR